MFTVAFDFDFQEFQKTHTKRYDFTDEEQAMIRQACELLVRASARVVLPLKDPVRDLLMASYFGANTDGRRAETVRDLRALDHVIQGNDRKITFVDGSHRGMQIKVNPLNLDQQPTWRVPALTAEDLADMGAVAWVHTLPGGNPVQGTYHVGSGMRIVLGPSWGERRVLRSRAGTIYHELAHKILGATDHAYDDQCRNLPDCIARRNADNYRLFVEEYMRAKGMA